MGSLDDVFWARVGCGHKDIDCKNFIVLCKESNLVDDNFKDSDAELVFQRAMPLSKRRLDFPRLKDALRRVAEIKGEEEQAIHRKLIEAHARNCKPYLKRTGSLPAVVARESPKNEGHERRRSASGTKRSKREKKEKGDKDKGLQLPNAASTPEHRRQSILLCPSSPANAMELPFSPSGHSQVPTTPTDMPCDSPDVAGGGLHDSPMASAGMPTPSSQSETSTALVSIPNTPSCHYLSCPATPANAEPQEASTPQCLAPTLLRPSCNPAMVMPHQWSSVAAATSAAPQHLPPPEEAEDAAALAIQAAQVMPETKSPASNVAEQRAEEASLDGALLLGAQPPQEHPSDASQQPSTTVQPKGGGPPVPRLPLGVCTEEGDMPSLLSSRQPSLSPSVSSKTLKRPVRKNMTRVVSLPAPIDTGSDVAQLVSEGFGPLPSSPQRSPGRAGLFCRSSPSASSVGKFDDFQGDKCRGSVEETFKAFCGEHSDMDSKSFVRVCKKCCLLDQKFTAHDARLVFSSAVPISHVRMDLQSFENALNHVASKRGLDMGLVTRMVSWYEQPVGPETQSAPTSPSHEFAPMGLPESPLGAKASNRPASASRSRASVDPCDRHSLASTSRQSSLPIVARRQDGATPGHPDCLASPGRARSNIECMSHLDSLAPLSAPKADDTSKVVSGKECISPHSALLPLQATLPIQTQVIMPHMMVGAF